MSIFNKVLKLSKQIAASLLKNETPNSLKQSELFNEEDEKYILENISNPTLAKERKDLKNKIDTHSDWQKVKPKYQVRKIYWKYAAAASIALIVPLTIFLKKEAAQPEFIAPIIVNNQIQMGSDKATLTLEDGSEVVLTKGKTFNVKNAISNGEEIIYKVAKKAKKEVEYNYLTVPRGGQYQITLSDNTKVWLNSDSKLKYPVSFSKGEIRQVELVYGEAYFDVSPSSENAGASFKVFNKNQEVTVLGTEFNIKAYKEESNIYTTLVEGKVVVNFGVDNKQFISPGQQINLAFATNSFTVTNVDVTNEIAWKDGIFNFEGKNLKDIMVVLSRWYDIDVTFQDKSLENEKYIGSLKRNYTIENILTTMQKASIINSFEINNKSVIIK